MENTGARIVNILPKALRPYANRAIIGGYVCKLKPKKLKYCPYKDLKMYYTAQKYGKICKDFTLKERNEE